MTQKTYIGKIKATPKPHWLQTMAWIYIFLCVLCVIRGQFLNCCNKKWPDKRATKQVNVSLFILLLTHWDFQNLSPIEVVGVQSITCANMTSTGVKSAGDGAQRIATFHFIFRSCFRQPCARWCLS